MKNAQANQNVKFEQQTAAQGIPNFWQGIPGMDPIFAKGGIAPAAQVGSYSHAEKVFIEAIIETAEALELIQKSVNHVMKLVRAGADETRILGALKEVQGICDDGQERIAATGLSWS